MRHTLGRREVVLSSLSVLAGAFPGCGQTASPRSRAGRADASLPGPPPAGPARSGAPGAQDANAARSPTDLSVLPPRLHQNDLRAFAVDPTGAILATGSTTPDPEKDDDFYDKGGALVVFDVATGVPLVSAAVAPGGVGWMGCTDALVFSAEGSRLLMTHDTNAVSVLDVSRGRIARLAEIRVGSYRGLDGPPAVAWHGEDHVVVDAGDLFVARADVDAPTDKGASLRPISTPDELALASTRLHGSIALGRKREHGMAGRVDVAVGIDVSQNKVAFQTPLRGHPAPGDTVFSASSGGRRVVYGDPDVTLVLDANSGAVLGESRASLRPEHATWSRDERRLALINNKSVVVFEEGKPLATIDRHPRELLWQELPDASPFAFSPDGERAVFLTASGDLDRLEGPRYAKRAWRAREAPGIRGVLWPQPDTLVCIGPRAITFRDAETGKLRSQHRW